MEDDPFALSRFVEAQAPIHAQALAELRAGRKTSHCMWIVFPQIAGLGRSAIAQHYAIRSLDEARAYLRHPVLGPRLLACTAAATAHAGATATGIFGSPDDLKFRSSMTLFGAAADDPAPFEAALARFYGGEPDADTLARLAG